MKIVSNGRVCHALVTTLLASGCATYAPKPIDWEHEQKNWSPQNAEPMTLTLDELKLLANVMNPEINRLRLRHATQKKEAQAAGWWDDPALDADVLRLLKGGAWSAGGALKFTLPLTGIPGLERKAAEAYVEAGQWEILLAEKRLEAEVCVTWQEYEVATAQMELLGAFAQKVAEWLSQAEKLQRAGEVSPEQVGTLRKASANAQTAAVASRLALPQKRAALLELAGIHPLQKIKVGQTFLSSSPAQNSQTGMSAPPLLNWLDESLLISHPAVMSKLAAFNATEQQLRVEIRKQYPEVSLGPALEYDDAWKGGAAFGVTLPLWNRNRAGIASAEGLREEARQECLDAWRALVYASHNAQAEIEALEEELRILETDVLPAVGKLYRESLALDKLGEMDVFTRFEIFQSFIETHVSSLELSLRLFHAKLRAVGEMLAVFCN